MDQAQNSNMGETIRRMGLADKYSNQKLERAVFDDIAPGLDENVAKRPVVLYNVSHTKRSPVARDPEKPAIRLLGVFRDSGEAVAQAAEMNRKLDSVDYWITPLGEWIMLHVDREEDPVSVSGRITDRLKRTAEKRQRDFDQLRAARDKQLPSHTGYHKAERTKRNDEKKAKECLKNKQVEGGTNTRDMTQKFIRNNQRYAVVSVVPDTQRSVRLKMKAPEPLVRVYGVYAGKKTAKDFIKNELSAHIGDYDLDIVDMYEWLHPHNVNAEDIVEEFRDPEINNIMQHAKEEKRTAKDFRKRCGLLGKEADMEYIVGESGKDMVSIVEKDEAPRLKLVEIDPAEIQENDQVIPEDVLRGLVGDSSFESVKREALEYYSSHDSSHDSAHDSAKGPTSAGESQ